jgi:hypothetical protein
MIGFLKSMARTFIVRNRQSMPIQGLHRVSRFVEDAYENIGSDISSNGELDLLRRLAPLGFTTVLDIGANVGDWSASALRLWPHAHVHAFEVASPTFAQYQARMAREQMYYFPEHPEVTCDRPRHPGLAVVPFQVEMTTGDDYLEASKLQHVDFLKIDVEGAEFQVLEGFARAMSGGRIGSIQFEYGAFAIQTRILLKDFYDLLGQRYWIGKLFPTHVEFADYDWTAEDFRFANFLCVARHRSDWKAVAEA